MFTESEDVFSILEYLPDMIFVKDAVDLKFVFINKAGEEVIGISRSEMLGKNDFDFFPDEQAKFFTGEDRKVIASGKMKNIPEEPLETPGGTLTLHTKKIPLKDKHGKVKYLVGISRDITQQKATENELRQSKRKAEEANQAKSTFLTKMSHEMRTPLNGVTGIISLLLGSPEAEPLKESLETMDDSARNLLALINDLLDISKIESGKIELVSEPFESRAIFEYPMRLLGQKAKEKGLRFEAKIADDLPQIVIGDAEKIKQVMVNLVDNAIKYTSDGSVNVLIEQVSKGPNESRIRFEIADSGVGIPENDQLKIFEPFFQGSTHLDGTGLGLAISKNLIELMGSELFLETKAGVGSTFTFEIDFEVTDIAAPKPTRRSTNRLDSRTKVLVVEDNQLNRNITRQMLGHLGVSSVTVKHGKEALGLDNLDQFNLILMDCLMPVMDGFEATMVIRKQFSKEALPIIALTASVTKDDLKRCLEVGMNGHLSKPVKIDELEETIAKWCLPLSADARM